MQTPFRAFRLFEDGGRVQGRVVDVALDDLNPGDVVVKVAYSSVNYKDALAATGGKIARRFPLVGGIDLAGVVESSTDPRFRKRDPVIVTGYNLSVTHDGGYAEYARVPAEWVVPMPPGLTALEAMTLGTAGFTAALSLVEMERNGLTPAMGPVIVTGATGGVGSMGVACLVARGYQVTALTGKDREREFLRLLGVKSILARGALVLGTKPLEKAQWAGAIDCVGGDILAWLTRTMLPSGCIAASGLTAGVELHTTVMPFILRGVKLLGIDSAACPIERRKEVWRHLALEMKPAHLKSMVREITLGELPQAFETLLTGQARGRYVVRLASAS
ncbi:MAG: oxidoreductase [Acidimicrobiia bacterium]|nr:oxidoreductase [Acidimicrobiia bacterium]